MSTIPDEIRSPIVDHLRVTERMLRLIEQLSHRPASCDHRLIQGYALQAIAHLEAAERKLNDTSPQSSR